MVDLNIPIKALFLDRDGIINVDHGYVNKIEDFTFNDKIFELMHLFIQNRFKLFIVTNQSGIGRGYYSLDDFKKLTQWMLKELKQREIEIEAVKFCQHSPETKCGCRKPATGMIDEILEEYEIDLEASYMIGDKQSDIDLALNSKIGKSISIGDRDIRNSDYHFGTIEECFKFFKD
jgi:D-glycero-D-manno-heptose 1,7-bisphosphate phosphatase